MYNFTKNDTFDICVYNNKLFDLDLSFNKNIVENLKKKLFFELSDDNTNITFTKLKDSNISLLIFGNYTFSDNTNCDNKENI